MRKIFQVVISLTVISALQACDGYRYEGKTSDQVIEEASRMTLPEVYEFYVRVYSNTHPPMMDAAGMFSKYGRDADKFLKQKALSTMKARELEADLMALAFVQYRCDGNDLEAFLDQTKKIGADEIYALERFPFIPAHSRTI